jgi:hypothetical protein
MVDPELVAIGAEAPARLTDLGVMPEPGGEGEEPQPDAGAQARECAHGANKYCQNGGVAFALHHGAGLAGVHSGGSWPPSAAPRNGLFAGKRLQGR